MKVRITPDDLEWAATWLDEYEDDELTLENGDDGPGVVFARVAEWMRQEADRRRREAMIRDIAARNDVSLKVARAALRKVENR